MTSGAAFIDLLPHRAPMRLVEAIHDVKPGESARGRRLARPDDWYFQGHFPGDPVRQKDLYRRWVNWVDEQMR